MSPLFGRRRREDDLDDEIRAHLEMAVRDRVARGESREAAERAVRREFGDPGRVKETTRRMWGGMWWDRLRQDVRLAVRSLGRNPVFSATAIGTLALGIGTTGGVFGMVNQLLLRPLPGVANSDEAAYLELRFPGNEEWGNVPASFPDVRTLREESTLLAGMGLSGNLSPIVTRPNGPPIELRAERVYGDFFEVLGATPAAGRLLDAEATEPASDPHVVVLSERMAIRLFGATDAAVGRTITADGVSFQVVGVVGGGFEGLDPGNPRDAWFPLSASIPLFGRTVERIVTSEAPSYSGFVVLPRPGVEPSAVEAEVASLVSGVPTLLPDGGWGEVDPVPTLLPGLRVSPGSREGTYRFLRLAALAAGLILAVACANVASLLLFRNLSLRGQLGVRRALGAPWMRIASHRLVESLVLGALGAIGGVGVAWLFGRVFGGHALPDGQPFEGVVLDAGMLGFVIAIGALTTLLAGSGPAVLAGRLDLRAAVGRGRSRGPERLGLARSVLTSAQIALTLSVLVGGLLMVRTLQNLNSVDTGLDIEGVARVPVRGPTVSEDPDFGAAELRALHTELLRSVEEVPSVRAAALDRYGPQSGSRSMGQIAPADPGAPEPALVVRWPVSPSWFELTGARLVSGRALTESDWVAGASATVVLTESLARRLFGTANAAGRMVRAGFDDVRDARVVGVISNYRSMFEPDVPVDAFFVPYPDTGRGLGYLSVLVRTSRFGPDTAESIRLAIQSVVPEVPIPLPTLLTDQVAEITRDQRMLGRLLWLLSGLGLLISAVGLYGVVAYTVVRRRRELGVRIAVGARGRQIAGTVLRGAVPILLVGLGAGLVGAFVFSRLLESQLFRVGPFDPAAFAMSATILTIAALLASWIPARGAMSVDPVTVLREE